MPKQFKLSGVITVDDQGYPTVALDPVTPQNPGANVPPTIKITSPADGLALKAPATIKVVASATDPDGTLARVDILGNGIVAITKTTPPWEYTWTGVPVGTYKITARATDGAGAVTTSAPVTVTVTADVPVPPDPQPPIPPIDVPVGPNDIVVRNTSELKQALASNPQPGTTLWMRGGTPYAGPFQFGLKGVVGKPIKVRAWPSERVTIDGGDSQGKDIVLVTGQYLWLWGIESMSSNGVRYTDQTGSDPSGAQIPMGECFTVGNNASQPNPGVKFINCIADNGRQGFSIWENASDAEATGCLAFDMGWFAPDRGHGHCWYTQCHGGPRIIKHCVGFGGASHGIQAYGSAGGLENIQAIENYMAWMWDRALLIGGGQIAINPSALRNVLVTQGGASQFGYSKEVQNASIIDNYFLAIAPGGPVALRFTSNTGGPNTFAKFSGNKVLGTIEGANPGGSTMLTAVPDVLLAYPNAYEAKRGNLYVLNGSKRTAVSVDLTAFGFVKGDTFNVRDSENFFGTPVLTGTYPGGTISVPLGPGNPAKPIGNVPPAMLWKSSAPLAYAFIVTR